MQCQLQSILKQKQDTQCAPHITRIQHVPSVPMIATSNVTSLLHVYYTTQAPRHPHFALFTFSDLVWWRNDLRVNSVTLILRTRCPQAVCEEESSWGRTTTHTTQQQPTDVYWLLTRTRVYRSLHCLPPPPPPSPPALRSQLSPRARHPVRWTSCSIE